MTDQTEKPPDPANQRMSDLVSAMYEAIAGRHPRSTISEVLRLGVSMGVVRLEQNADDAPISEAIKLLAAVQLPLPGGYVAVGENNAAAMIGRLAGAGFKLVRAPPKVATAAPELVGDVSG